MYKFDIRTEFLSFVLKAAMNFLRKFYQKGQISRSKTAREFAKVQKDYYIISLENGIYY